MTHWASFPVLFLSACLLGRNVYSNPSAIFLPNCSARASSTILNRSGKSGDHCLLPDFRRNTFSLSLWSVKLVLWNSVQFCQMLFSIYYVYHEILVYEYDILQLINFHTLNQPWIPGLSPSWSGCIILFLCFWVWFASNLLRIFISIFTKDIGL